MCQSLRELQGRLSSWDNPYKAHMLLFSHLPFLRAGLLTQKWETKVQGSAVHLKAEILIALHRRKVSNWPLSIPISIWAIVQLLCQSQVFLFLSYLSLFLWKAVTCFQKEHPERTSIPKKGTKEILCPGAGAQLRLDRSHSTCEAARSLLRQQELGSSAFLCGSSINERAAQAAPGPDHQ